MSLSRLKPRKRMRMKRRMKEPPKVKNRKKREMLHLQRVKKSSQSQRKLGLNPKLPILIQLVTPPMSQLKKQKLKRSIKR